MQFGPQGNMQFGSQGNMQFGSQCNQQFGSQCNQRFGSPSLGNMSTDESSRTRGQRFQSQSLSGIDSPKSGGSEILADKRNSSCLPPKSSFGSQALGAKQNFSQGIAVPAHGTSYEKISNRTSLNEKHPGPLGLLKPPGHNYSIEEPQAQFHYENPQETQAYLPSQQIRYPAQVPRWEWGGNGNPSANNEYYGGNTGYDNYAYTGVSYNHMGQSNAYEQGDHANAQLRRGNSLPISGHSSTPKHQTVDVRPIG